MSTDYSKMSDFEINCEVLAVFNPDIKHMSISGDNSCFYDCGPTGDGWNQIDIPDYCNNPADAWPIIIDNKISIVSLDNKWIAAPVDAVIDGITGDSEVCFYASCDAVSDANPIRAAMIVFLMMQDEKNG